MLEFVLPAGIAAAGLPRLSGTVEVTGDTVVVHTVTQTADLHALTGWAIDHAVALDTLTVSRPTLEDVYLELTAGAPDGH